MSDNGPEGTDVRGELSNAQATSGWPRISARHSRTSAGATSFGFIGTDWANASTGGLQWWKWFIGEGGVRVPLIIVPPQNKSFAKAGQRPTSSPA